MTERGGAGRPPAGKPRTPTATRAPEARRRRAEVSFTERPARGRPGTNGRGGSVLVARRVAITGRAAVLALAVLAVGLTLAYPARQYLSQRAELAQLRAEHQAAVVNLEKLRRTRTQLADPEHVRDLARTRLHYAMPGETVYQLVGEPPAPAQPPAVPGGPPPGTWYEKLWASTQEAARPAPVAP